ncbi:MAG: GatB/YqeY domain-containing protein [Bacteroidia bacterium]|nr:GatB/YqeY domain-containing protein [Bacteroidia bacterium]
MALETQIQNELKTAMLSKNEAALRALRAVKSAILLAKTSGLGDTLSPEDEVKLLHKLVKQRKESMQIYKEQGRDDLALAEEEEMAVIEKFLPAQMSETEITEAIKKIITDTGATNASHLGKVMGIASKQLAGKADNKIISGIVKQLLS